MVTYSLITQQTLRFSAVNLLIDGTDINNIKYIANDPFETPCLPVYCCSLTGTPTIRIDYVYIKYIN